MLLHALVAFPLIAAAIIALGSGRDSRAASRLSLIFAGIWILLALPLLSAGEQTSDPLSWFTLWGTGASVQYQLRADGLSSWLLQLVVWLTPVALLAGMRSAGERMREVAVLVFLCVGMMSGLLLCTDLVVFYCFYEGMLLPMLLLIWLHGDEDRRSAGMRFFIMTMLASVFLLAGIWFLVSQLGSSDIETVIRSSGFLSDESRWWLFLAFLAAFAVKIPLLPLHGWQAPVYAAAPSAGTILLSGAMAKMGIYGLLRLVLPIFPAEVEASAPCLMSIAGVAVVYGALMALAQSDLKRLLAYSSLGHLGLIAFGVFSRDPLALSAALVAMLAHGLSVGALFALVGWLEQQAGHRRIDGFGGIAKQAPLVGLLLVASGLALIALPGSAGFIGELGILIGSFRAGVPLWALALVGSSVILGAWYLLRMLQRVVFGPVPTRGALLDLRAGAEAVAVIPLLLLSLLFGLWAAPLTRAADASLASIATPLPVLEEKSDQAADDMAAKTPDDERWQLNAPQPSPEEGD